MRRFACMVAVALLLAAPAIAQAVPDQYLITPGVGIGPVRIGMHIADATKILGTPALARRFEHGAVLPTPDGATSYQWNNGLTAQTDRAGTIYFLGENDWRYATPEGLHVKSAEADIRSKLGDPSRVVHENTWDFAFVMYDHAGIGFLIRTAPNMPDAHTVIQIGVFVPR